MSGKAGKKIEFNEQRLIICEGPHDRAFFRELVDERNLPLCKILCPADHVKKRGKSGFVDMLAVIRGWGGFERLAEVIIATDSDADAEVTFNEVARMVQDVQPPIPPDPPHVYPVPTAPHVKAIGSPSVTILMVPWLDEVGSLETLLFTAATRGNATKIRCVDRFAQCCKADAWPPQKVAKMRIRSFIAGYLEERPDLALGRAWIDARGFIPIHDRAFSRIAEFLRDL